MGKERHIQAWEKFWEIKSTLPTWKNKTRAEKAPAYVANQAANSGKHLGPVRVARMLELYAPGVFDTEISFKKIEK